ncbi:MAG: trypsin-like peptidase domain-containing protein [Phycisphaeraceae bacterium]|nr:trypsin-like peptidase domain-containing protein [Phycisphaeraceae bacterium]
MGGSLLLALSLCVLPAGAKETKAPETEPDPNTAALLTGKRNPNSAEDLQALQKRFQSVAEQALKTTVAVRIGQGNGSGVIISKDGFVLTAAHVIGAPGRDLTVVLQDGRQLRGKSLGLFQGADAGLIKVETDQPLPAAEMGDVDKLSIGAWCVATGHSGGLQKGRTAPVRVGRVLYKRSTTMVTDCALVGGDSGGPLFGLDGKVIGIHSRIGSSLKSNLHVPVNVYKKTWDRLAKGDVWGARKPKGSRKARAFLGVGDGPDGDGSATIGQVIPGTPAARSGLEVGDKILQLGKIKVDSFEGLIHAIRRHKPGQRIKVRLLRDGKQLELPLTLGAR